MAAALTVGVVVDGLQAPQQQIGVQVHRAAIHAYRVVLKPIIAGSTHCKFEPTCSEYSLRVVQRHGWPRGSLLTFQRLASCR